jgi:hypothetical protein
MNINSTTIKTYAADVLQVAVVVAAVLAVILNVSGAIHLPAQDVAIIATVAGVVNVVVVKLRAFLGIKVAALRAARAARH